MTEDTEIHGRYIQSIITISMLYISCSFCKELLEVEYTSYNTGEVKIRVNPIHKCIYLEISTKEAKQ